MSILNKLKSYTKFILVYVVICGLCYNRITPVYAQTVDVASSYVDFSGGLNDQDAPQYLANNESPDLLNVDIDNPVGALKQRTGYIEFGNTPSGNPAINMYEYIKNSGARYLIVADQSSIWATSDGVTFSTITTGLVATSLNYFATVRDDLWIVNKTTSTKTWDGTTTTHLNVSTTTLPDVPQGQYIAFWKERVWIARTNSEPSSVYFSDIANTAGDILHPKTSTAAWSALNAFYINREDGSPIYGIKVYRDNLFVFKETGIFRIIFESEFDAGITKAVSNIGCKFQDSIVEIDNYLYFVGPDGIYKFDGVNALRISDKIQHRFDAIKQASISDQFKLWDTASDWVNGSLSNSNTSYNLGSITLEKSNSYNLIEDFSSGAISALWNGISAPASTIMQVGTTGGGKYGDITGLTYSNRVLYISTTTKSFGTWKLQFSPIYKLKPYNFVFISDTNGYPNNGYMLKLTSNLDVATTLAVELKKIVSGVETLISSATATNLSTYSHGYNGCNLSVTRDLSSIFNITSTDCTLSFSGNGSTYIGDSLSLSFSAKDSGVGPFITRAFIDNIYTPYGYLSTGTFTSEISTMTSVSTWSTFDVDETLNGQTIDYSIRYASSVYNTSNATWHDITPGTIIQAGTNTYTQWRATFTTTDNGVTPLLNSAIINWSEGGVAQNRLFAFPYKNRMWLAGSTVTANTYNDTTFVKSRSPLDTWTLNDIPLASMAKLGSVFLGAIANSGKIVRLDYGNNDNGSTINSHWTSRDELYGFPIYYKKISEVVVDYAKGTNTSIAISASPDNGETYTSRTFSLASGSAQRQTKRLNYDLFDSPNTRFKISNSLFDFGFVVYGLHSAGKASKYSGR